MSFASLTKQQLRQRIRCLQCGEVRWWSGDGGVAVDLDPPKSLTEAVEDAYEDLFKGFPASIKQRALELAAKHETSVQGPWDRVAWAALALQVAADELACPLQFRRVQQYAVSATSRPRVRKILEVLRKDVPRRDFAHYANCILGEFFAKLPRLFSSKEALLEAWPAGSRTRLRDEVLRLLDNAGTYVQGKNPRSVVTAAIWLISSTTMGKPPTQKELACMFEISEVTIRNLSKKLISFLDEEMREKLPPVTDGVPVWWLSDGWRKDMMDAFNRDRDTAHLPRIVFAAALDILKVAHSVSQHASRVLTVSASRRALWGAAVRLAAYQMGFLIEHPVVARIARVYPSNLLNAEAVLRTTLTSSKERWAYRWPEQWGREETPPSC